MRINVFKQAEYRLPEIFLKICIHFEHVEGSVYKININRADLVNWHLFLESAEYAQMCGPIRIVKKNGLILFAMEDFYEIKAPFESFRAHIEDIVDFEKKLNFHYSAGSKFSTDNSR
jgi:hypothetical protein